MTLRFSAFLMFALFITAGCKDSSTNSGNDDSELDKPSNGLAIKAVNTGTGDLEISTDSDAAITFCYESDDCETAGGFSFHTIVEGDESLIDYSSVEGKAVGVNIAFHVDAGSGYIEVVSGYTYKDDAGFLEFEEDEVLYTSDGFTEGTIVQDSYGDTN